MNNEIGIWFLLLSLFFPRMVLFFWWMTHNLPMNTTPFLADITCSIFFPRILILVYIYQNQEFSAWFWIHFAVMFLAYLHHIFNYHRNLDRIKSVAKI